MFPLTASGLANPTIPYEVESEVPAATALSWNPQITAFTRHEIVRQKSEVTRYIQLLKVHNATYLTGRMIKNMLAKYPALQISAKACNFSFVFLDFASWGRPTCEFKYVDMKNYLLAALQEFLNKNPGYNATEDYLGVISALEEIAANHWDYTIKNGWFSCPKQITMGTSAGFPMESKAWPTVRALRVTISPEDKWKFSVKVLARDFKALAAKAKVSPKSVPYGIEFNY